MQRRNKTWASLDATDWAILAALGADARLTNQDLAARVGLSAAPTLRRVRALESAGFILGYHARLNDALLGFGVTAYVSVKLASQTEADLLAFEALARRWDAVRDCALLLGEADFILRCVVPDHAALQSFITRDLTGAANVDGVKVAIALRQTKAEPGPAL